MSSQMPLAKHRSHVISCMIVMFAWIETPIQSAVQPFFSVMTAGRCRLVPLEWLPVVFLEP